MVLLEFPYKFVSEKVYGELKEEEKKLHKILDPDIIEKLTTDEELSGLLNMALEGLDRLLGQKPICSIIYSWKFICSKNHLSIVHKVQIP